MPEKNSLTSTLEEPPTQQVILGLRVAVLRDSPNYLFMKKKRKKKLLLWHS